VARGCVVHRCNVDDVARISHAVISIDPASSDA
jgi:hypothetical protein